MMDPAKAGDNPEKKLGTFVLTWWLTAQVQLTPQGNRQTSTPIFGGKIN